MKTIFKALGLGALMTAFIAIGGLTTFAQDPCGDLDAINALDAKIRADYPKQETKKAAIDEGKQYLEKYGNCEVTKDFSNWLKGQIPKWEQAVSLGDKQKDQAALHTRFDTAIKNKTYDDAFAATTEFIGKYPDDPTNIHQMVALGMIGPIETASTAKNTKYNANSEKFAKMAIEQLKSGNAKPLDKGNFGVFQFVCASKDDCISVLTFGIGYMNYYGNNNKQAALPYYYEVTKIPGTYKTSPSVYSTIGDYYYETVAKMVEEVKAAIADQKDTDTDDVRQKKIADIKTKVAMLNGYTERAMDAYSRAYTFAKADASQKKLSDALYEKLKALYAVRTQKTEGVDTWISSAVTKPFPDPTSPVEPIADDSTTGDKGTGVGEANGTGVGAANGTGVGAAKGTGVGGANGTGVGNSAAAKTTPAKPAKPRQ
jgi:tetratricopeptide (TPR) repeat protein